MGIRQEKRTFRRWRGIAVLFIALCIALAALCAVLYIKSIRESGVSDLEARISALERENDALRAELAALRERPADPEEAPDEAGGEAAPRDTEPASQTADVRPPEDSPATSDSGQGETAPAGSVHAPVFLTLEDLAPGTVVNPEQLGGELGDYFAAYGIAEGDAVFERINGRSYRENDDISLSGLKYLKVLHYNFDHKPEVGEMIVNAAIADDVLAVFRELFEIEYEIEKMYLIDDYWTGDGETSDSASIDDNNTSCFCYRTATGSGRLSYHALGRAIDINPQQNPYVSYSDGTPRWSHENANDYIDRTSGDPHVIVRGDACYNIFTKYGFSWGGDWSNPKDYQHFEKKN